MPGLEARLRNTAEDVNGFIIMATGGYMSQTITATHADWRALAHQAHALFAGDANPRDRATSIPQITVAPSQGEFHVVGRFNNGFNITAECCLRIAGLAAAVMLCNNAGVNGALDISVEHKDQVNPVLGSGAASPMCPALVLRVVGAGTTPIHMRTQIASDEDGYAALGSFTSALEQSSLDDQHAALVYAPVFEGAWPESGAVSIFQRDAYIACGGANRIVLRLPGEACLAAFQSAHAHYESVIRPALQAARLTRAARLDAELDAAWYDL